MLNYCSHTYTLPATNVCKHVHFATVDSFFKRLLFITRLQTFDQNRTYQLCACSEVNISVDVQAEIYLK